MDQDATRTEVGLGPGHIVLDGDPAPPPLKGHSSPHLYAHVYCGPLVAHLSNCCALIAQLTAESHYTLQRAAPFPSKLPLRMRDLNYI